MADEPTTGPDQLDNRSKLVLHAFRQMRDELRGETPPKVLDVVAALLTVARTS